jgi:sugar lactone lactonase YvrE
VAKIDKNGVWVKSWGDRGSQPGQFSTLHSIATDAQGNVYVADRSNRRIQVFDGDGKFLRMFQVDVPFDPAIRSVIGNTPPAGPLNQPGASWVVCIPPNSQVLYTADSYPGRIYKLSLPPECCVLDTQKMQSCRRQVNRLEKSKARSDNNTWS